ncbi:uncharacterized protein [Amphiura filiformis]|uniref:uncharacterized protein n=1 Tax=Amphiura filiformis TaxID=82378 RepID=UPI003B21AC9E
MALCPVMNDSGMMGVNTNHYMIVLFLTIFVVNITPSYQQSCTGPAAGVGNRCRFGDAVVCCVSGATCSSTTDYCECPLGKTGPLCDQVCPLNSDGTACESDCGSNTCSQESRCRQQTDALCICNPQYEGHNCERCIVGFRGTYCDLACPVASDSVSCESACSRNPCSQYSSPTCIQSQSGCQCKQGAKGINCEITCPTSETLSCEISCIDNHCHTTHTCRETATGCQCIASHYDATCDRTCLAPGSTGLDCTIACPLGSDLRTCESDCTSNPCHQANTCRQTSAGCHCLPGYYGQNCNLCNPREVVNECRGFCEYNGYPCESGSHCDITSGQCSCPDGLSGSACQYCEDGYQGGCSQFCESDCYGSNWVCNTKTGSCECATGFSGHNCRTCDPGTHLQQCRDFCPDSCDTGIMCDITARQCVCKTGFSGSSCEYCYPSEHPNQCREYCEYRGYACESGSSCLITTGKCACPKGQDGSTCQYCTSSMHNLECKNFCPQGCYGTYQICDTQTSQCECYGGFTGADCDMCDPTDHQRSCLDFCPHICSVGTFCDINTRTCTCEDGYLGDQCMYCRPSLNPQGCTQDCSYYCEKGDCYVPTGECVCYQGFSGPDCSLCEPMEANNYCRSYCDVECQNGGLCDVYDGTCYCSNPNYSGSDCSLCNKTLEAGACRRVCGKECLNGGLCNTSSLVCECSPGYVLGDCSWCDPQEDSNQCLQHCKVECLHNGHCDTLTGACECQENYTGSDCGLCIPRLHPNRCHNYCGVECKNNATCNTQSGSCVCLPGYNGSDCSELCVECRVPICDLATQQCEGATQAPNFSMASSGQTVDPQGVRKNRNQILLIGVGSAVAAILIVIIIILLISVWRKGSKKDRFSPSQAVGDHVPVMDSQGPPKHDNTYCSQANILMSTRSYSQPTDDEYDAVCNSETGIAESQDLYTYCSTQEVQGKLSDSGNFSESNSQIYAYASPDQLHSTTSEPYNSLDFSGNSRKSQLPVVVDAQYNRLEVGPTSDQSGVDSSPCIKPGRVKGNMYEDPADLIPPDKPSPARSIPPYAQVKKVKKGGEAKGAKLDRKRPATMTLKEDKLEDGLANPSSPRYTVVEPDISDTDSEDTFLQQPDTGEASNPYAEACREVGNGPFQDTDNSTSKSRMPPYAKVNKK